MKIITTPRAVAFVRDRGGEVWVWLDPHRGIVGSHVWLEAHCEPPRTSRRSTFTRSSRRPHHFDQLETGGMRLHFDFGRMAPPDELHFDRKGWRRGTHRLEAYWNGCVFVGEDIPAPDTDR